MRRSTTELEGIAALAAQHASGGSDAFQVLMQAIPAAIVVTDRELRVLAVSSKWLLEMRRTEDEVLGRCLYDIAPDYFPHHREVYDRCLAGERHYDPAFHAPKGGGGAEWWRTETVPWRDASGAVGGLITMSIDVTDVMAALERVEKSEERMQVAVELADVHVWEVDLHTGESWQAGAAESFFDGSIDPAEMARDTNITIHPEDRALIAGPWREAVLNDRPFRPEYRINRQDGKEVWAACTTRLVRDEQGAPRRLLGAMQNITQRKQAELALVRAKEEAEAANRAKSTFLATMSHEIRTPLNGVLGMAQAMAADELTPVQRERLETVRQSGETLLAILNDILDLSKVEAGKLELEIADFAMSALLSGVHGAFAGVADAKAVRFVLDMDPDALGVYRGDPTRLRQILSNLVSNALKFTAEGEVSLCARRKHGRLVFEVRDTGIGIPADRLPRLFTKFEQADASTTRRFGGTGLGLAICRDLTGLMGGTIGVDSRDGEGSTFRVSIPLPRIGDEMHVPTAEAAEPAGLPEARVRILAAEDNPVNQTVLRTLLQQAGVDPVIVNDGAEALAAWRDGSWDLILMDVQMPVMDGPTAARAIRAEETGSARPRTPIIALTANAMSHQLQEYVEAGMDGVVAKPIRIEELFAAIQAALEDASAEQPAARCA